MYTIVQATVEDTKEILALYKMQIGREFCPWDDHYPTEYEIEYDLGREALFVMKDGTSIIAAISLDKDDAVEALSCWSKELAPGGELSRLAVHPDYQNQGIARKMLLHGMKVLADRGYKSVHFLVNKHNIKAIRSYDALTFNIVGECDLYDQPFLCYEKALWQRESSRDSGTVLVTKETSPKKLYFAPLEGITGYIYRNAYEKLYGHIDKYFAPFMSPADNCAMNPKERKDVLPENNQGITLVPQILTCKSNHFIDALKELQQMGYREVNLNLGCPSGTVCAKGKGAGFLPETDKLNSFLEDIYTYGDANGVAISLKTRLGYYDADEFYDLLDIFNQYPVKELIVHPRIRNDYYKGEPRLDYYKYAIVNSKNPLVYNGNIFEKCDYKRIADKIGQPIECAMLGRGVITNPELACNLLKDTEEAFDYKRFWEFHDIVYHAYQEVMSPDIHVLYRMKELWTYWKAMFPECEREMKHVLKAKKYVEYESALRTLK